MSRVLAFVVAAVLSLTAGCAAAPSAGEPNVVRVAAASDLRFAMEDVAQAMTDSGSDVSLALTYGSSGTLAQQLANGAPFDLFLSADLAYPADLVAAGLADSADVFEYAVGRLVVWSANSSPVDARKGMAVLASPQASRVAIANPEHAPYGVAAVQAMKSAGVYEQVQDNLVLGENIAQAAEFAQSGNAEVGVIALSLAVAPQLADVGRWSEVPLDSFARLRQGGVVLGSAADPEAAREVRDFLLSAEGRAILKRYGFFEARQ